MKKVLLKQIIRDFHTTPLPALRRRALQVPTGTGKIVTLVGARLNRLLQRIRPEERIGRHALRLEAFELNGINIGVVPLSRCLLS